MIAAIPRPRRRKPARRFPPEVLSDPEVRALLDACPDSVPGQRNRALLTLLYRSGLRIRESLDLFPKDLDLEVGAVRVLCGKGGRFRVAGIDPVAAAVVRDWIVTRAGLGLDGRSQVFCAVTGGRLTEAYVRRLLPRLAAQAGIEKRVHAHGLRHTHAAQLRQEGVDIGIISKQLGHRSIATTARYLDHIAPVAVIEAIAGRTWGEPEASPPCRPERQCSPPAWYARPGPLRQFVAPGQVLRD